MNPYTDYVYTNNMLTHKKQVPVKQSLKLMNKCHPCCSCISIARPILAAITIVCFAIFGAIPKYYGFAIAGGVAAGILLYTIIFGAAFGAAISCKYIWCACKYKADDLLIDQSKILSKNQQIQMAIEEIPNFEVKKEAQLRFQRVRCYDCCMWTSIFRIVSVLLMPILFSLAFCIPNISEELKWSFVGIGAAAGAFLFYAVVFGAAFAPLFNCDFKYTFCTYCIPKDTTFTSDYSEYLKVTDIDLKVVEPVKAVQVLSVPQMPVYNQPLPAPMTTPLIGEIPQQQPVMPQPVDIKFQMVI